MKAKRLKSSKDSWVPDIWSVCEGEAEHRYPRLILHHQLHVDLSVKKAKEAALNFIRKLSFVPVFRFYVLFVFCSKLKTFLVQTA